MDRNAQKKVLAVSSEVGIGAVGLSILRFVLAAQKVSLLSLPTVFLPSRPDMGTVLRHIFPAQLLEQQIEALNHDGLLDTLDGVLTGYFAEAEQVTVMAKTIRALKTQNPDLYVLVDPVLGDFDTGLYVPSDVAARVRDELVPLADIITPNLFEFLWLTGEESLQDAHGPDVLQSLFQLRYKVAVPRLVITSAQIRPPKLLTCLIADDVVTGFESHYFPAVPKGTGDVFAATLLGHLLQHGSSHEKLEEGVRATVKALERVADKAQGLSQIEPYLLFNPNKNS